MINFVHESRPLNSIKMFLKMFLFSASIIQLHVQRYSKCISEVLFFVEKEIFWLAGYILKTLNVTLTCSIRICFILQVF